MKALVEKYTGEVKFVFADNVPLVFQIDRIIAPELIMLNMDNDNTTVYENVTPPEDWIGCKYLFDGTNWTLNPNWVDPRPVEMQA